MHCEIMQNIFKCANFISYDTKIDAICHVNKPRTCVHTNINQIFGNQINVYVL